ncbi:MAG: hypothetical protein HY906_17700 [Deltaproteobacteria bacterium]|nr:hypothetical protein [Deltaproteobacteria bacterium]
MPQRLVPHPFEELFGQPALELALHRLDSLPVQATNRIVLWLRRSAEGLTEGELREPTIRVGLFESYVVSLLNLAGEVTDMRRYAPDWNAVELEESAGLLLAAALVRRASAQTAAPVASTDAGEQAAARRGWRTVEDAVTDLKEYEDALVELGEAALSDRPAALDAWRKDQDDGTFEDAAGDVRRRLDFVADKPTFFAGTVIDADYLQRGETLHSDAWAFFRGREGRGVPKTQLTLARDQAFTLLLARIERLRLILAAAYRENPEARAKVEGRFWRRLERLSKPRRKRTTEPEAPAGPAVPGLPE